MGDTAFRAALEGLINRESMENASNTPDFILADYLQACLAAFDVAVQQRETWYGRDPRPTIKREVERVRALEAIAQAAHRWDHWGKVKALHVLSCKECERLEGVEDRWCDEARKIAREQFKHAKALQAALAQAETQKGGA